MHVWLSFMIVAAVALGTPADVDLLAGVVAGPQRSEAFRLRDRYRHPREVLEYFELAPELAVAEIWPGGGWWSEILAPYLAEQGQYYAVSYSLTARRTPQWRREMARELIDKFQQRPELYGNAIITSLSVPEDTEIAPPGSLDRVLTFRNVHNWIKGEYEAGVFEAMFRALKPGGLLGVVEHRAPPGADLAFMKESGYVTEEYVTRLATGAGFELISSSELNANPADSKDHPAGVWTLPPSLRHCAKLDDAKAAAACRAHYNGIGESDRMTLKFRKPLAD